MLRVIIVDDEPMNRSVLEEMISQFIPSLEVVASVASVKQAIHSILQHSPDVVFLDVEMPGNDGFGLLEYFKHPDFYVIFTTSHEKYAIRALKSEALDYLLKPIRLEDLKASVDRVFLKSKEKNILERIDNSIAVLTEKRKGLGSENTRIALPTFDGLEFYQISDIIRCEADRSYCTFHLRNGDKLLVSRPLRDFEDVLVGKRFIRIHKSNMINLDYVDKYIKGRGGFVVMCDGSKLQVSARRKNDFLDLFNSVI